MHNRGSSTVEMSVIMAVVFMSLMLLMQCYFAALTQTQTLSNEMQCHSEKACDIGDTVKRLRRWQWVDEKI